MQQSGWKVQRAQGNDAGAPQGRAAPKGMPQELPQGSRVPTQRQKPRDVLPTQKPITDEENAPKPIARWKVILRRVGVTVLLLAALAIAYVFLLLAEPDNAAVEIPKVQEEAIRVPMAAIEARADADIGAIAATFGKPILALYGDALPLEKITLYDTAFRGGYARRATLSYAFADGQILSVDSIRPTAAATLLGGSGYSLQLDGIHGLAGLDAARMDSAGSICIFGKSDQAVYAVTCPEAHAGELPALLKQTTLWQAEVQPQ